jgi:DNA-binding CsgD family transcriptional regulator
MKWQRHELVGRSTELDALRRHSGEPALLVVRGPEGSGKTALLQRFRAECDGVVLDLTGGPAWDEYRARTLLDAVRADFEAFADGPRVAESIDAVSRLCVPDSYATPGQRHRLLGAVSVLLTRIRRRLVIVVDDAERVPVSALAPMHRAGHTVVAACGPVASRELCSLADLVIDLAPLTEDDIARLLWQVAAAPVDEAVPRALRENLGPLYGNAGTLVSTVEYLWDEGRLGLVHGVLALRAPRAPIALPAGHRLLDELDEHGRTLVQLVAGDREFRVDHIPALAEVTGHSAHDYGQAVDRLVREGVLAHETNGRLRCRTRAVGAALAEPCDQPYDAGRSYQRVCRGYADGDWTDALSAARELELTSDVDVQFLDAARLLAAEICGWRGEDRQAASWLAAVTEDTSFPALRGWVATGLLDHAGEHDPFDYGWDWYQTHADLEEPGTARLLTRLASIAADAGDRHRARAVLRVAQDRYGPTSETALLVRGIAEGDGASVRAAERVIRERGTRFELALTCQRLASLSGEPRPWLDEAYELARSIGAAKLVSRTRRAMAGCGVTVPVRRARHTDMSDVERQIVELIRLGKTNRQIALALRVSTKTVEKHLTRLFAKAGCRTRHGLAMSGLGVRQELVGA